MAKNNGTGKKIIFVNSTAATGGGALTVLMQFLDGINKYDKENLYYIFSTAPEVLGYENENIRIISNIYQRKWIGRILWDNFGIEKWMSVQRIKPDLIVSLQNTGVRLGRKVKQIIYYHQSLPMYHYEWSLLKKEERKLWLYKNIYPWFVKRHFFRNDILVVQSDWMKEAASSVLNIDLNQIKVIKTTLFIEEADQINHKNLSEDDSIKEDSRFKLIYPATSMVFKNHRVIYRALATIAEKRKDIINNLKLYVTVEKESVPPECYSLIEENIEFMKNLKYEELLEMYSSMDLLVFPSYLETVGLPLLEAEYYGLPIIASDLPFATEAVGGYPGAAFVKYDDDEAWADAIIWAYENRRKYDGKQLDKRDTWEDMFLLIKKQLG